MTFRLCDRFHICMFRLFISQRSNRVQLFSSQSLVEMKRKLILRVFILFGGLSLAAQLLLFVILFYHEKPEDRSTDFYEDASRISNITMDVGCPLFVVHSGLLMDYVSGHANDHQQCVGCSISKNRVIFAAHHSCLNKIDLLMSKLLEEQFVTTVLHNSKVLQIPPKELILPIALAVKRTFPFIIMLLHSREDNFWWHGSVHNDPTAKTKLNLVGLTLEQAATMQTEGALRKVELQTTFLASYMFILPQNVTKFLESASDLSSSRFIECDYRRADIFFRTHGRDMTRGAVRFQHQAWKLLSRVNTLLGRLNVPFWLSSGTCLGFHRQCDFIPYSRDVDIGIMAKDFSEHMVAEFLSHNFALKHIFGKPNDSWELSFMSGGIKLDIFFFYNDKEKGISWNGGTQAKTGKKFKYVFPQFTLCWTEFLELFIRVPCDTETYIEANYGSDWFTPRTEWDWKSSPPNVQENGVWPSNELSSVVQVFPG